jgi:hypothetical protein
MLDTKNTNDVQFNAKDEVRSREHMITRLSPSTDTLS